MSASNIQNLNESIATVTLAAGVAQTLVLPYTPEFIEITNSGTGTAYVKGILNGGAAMTVPPSTFPALPATQPGKSIQPGASKTYRFPLPTGVTATTIDRISMISAAGTTLDVSIGRGV